MKELGMGKQMIKGTVNRLLASAGYEVRRKANKPVLGNTVHFLHIGKNAGTQVVALCDQINASGGQNGVRIRKEPHHVSLRDLPVDARYFFSTRDPIKRFKSGFYSRQRKGQPRLNSEWSTHEEAAFGAFEHANDLAEALFEKGPLGRKALGAIHSIRHTAMNQIDWFCQTGNFLEIRPPVAILRQEHLSDDFDAFKSHLGVSLDLVPEIDKGKAHATDYAAIPELSEKACENLRRWYAQDFEFVARCERWVQENMY